MINNPIFAIYQFGNLFAYKLLVVTAQEKHQLVGND